MDDAGEEVKNGHQNITIWMTGQQSQKTTKTKKAEFMVVKDLRQVYKAYISTGVV